MLIERDNEVKKHVEEACKRVGRDPREVTVIAVSKTKPLEMVEELRKEKGYTQVKMQLLTGIDQSDYSKIENGKRYYTFEQCRKIALALETSMDYLAELTDEKKPYPRIVKK